jgi:hypothetical protein
MYIAALETAWRSKMAKVIQDAVKEAREPLMTPKPREETTSKQQGTVGRVRCKYGKRPLHLVTKESLVTFKGAISSERGRGHIAVDQGESGRPGSRDSESRQPFQEVWLRREGEREDNSFTGRQG